jgi:protein-S-isoprenylcysteine O-methyltransferase Ste14
MATGLKSAVWSLAGLASFGLLLFLPAGTLAYWQAWVFLGAFFLASAGPSIFLVVKDPAAIERRMQAGQETRPVQKVLITLVYLLFPGLMVFCGFDHRFGWSSVPTAVVLIGDLLVVAGMVLAMAALLQNRHAAGNIRVEAGQEVISTGLYGVIRHPMYTGALIMSIGMPIALGSWWGLVFLVPVVAVLVLRILDEEKALEQELEGYREYLGQTRFRLAPHLW